MKPLEEVVETPEDGLKNPSHFQHSVSGGPRGAIVSRKRQSFDVVLLKKTVIAGVNARRLSQHAPSHRLQ